MPHKLAIYPGTFDPITKGHLHIIKRASKQVDKLIVAVADNSRKGPRFNLAERLEMESEHGKRVMGVLLFQDLAVVPLLVLIPALGSSPEKLLGALALAGLKATVLITVLLVGGQRVMRWWLTLVARRRSEELFVLNLLLITLGLAWLTELVGLSLALGAFIAGMLISETEYRYQVEADIKPFRDILLGLFFITIGMKMNFATVIDHFGAVLAVLIILASAIVWL